MMSTTRMDRPLAKVLRHRRPLGLLASFGVWSWVAVGAALAQSTAGAPAPTVTVLTATGVVDTVMAGYIAEGVQGAARDGSAAVIIRLDTPGGSLLATSSIVSTLLEAPVPTIVWVAPSGGRAASAGTFITLASHIAVMAPGTNIGAASPVAAGANLEGDERNKAFNDAIANIRSIAETRHRNTDWAVKTVEEAKASSAAEAVTLGAVDGLAGTLDEVLAFADGKTVTAGGREIQLALRGAVISERPMNPFQGFLHILSDPNIAFILFTIGFYGLLFELQNPNFVTGTLGAIAILLAFIGFGSLPLNVAGLLLIALAVVLFALEFTVTSHGLLAVGGTVCFLLGAAALYTEPSNPAAPDVAVATPVLVAMTSLTAGFAALGVFTVVRVRRRMLAYAGGYGTARSSLVPAGVRGTARTPLAPTGVVYAMGEEWTARADGEAPISAGTPVRVVRQDGLTLIVEPSPDVQPAGA
jgi:membrane-bound serine protease (ClpP class)